MKRFLHFTDVHMADVPPAMRVEGYSDQIIAKLEELSAACRKYNIDFALFTGDWFHLKAGTRITHTLVNRSLEILNNFSCDVVMLPGNHDIPYNRIDLLDSRPFGTLLKSRRVMSLVDTTIGIYGKVSIQLIPVPGITTETTESVREKIESKARDDAFTIALVHQPIVPSGSYPFPVIKAGDLVGAADLILYGHIHSYHGTYSLSVDGKTTWFSNVGAVARGVLTEDEIIRQPKYLVFGIDDKHHVGEFKYKEVVLKSALSSGRVFRLADKQASDQREMDIDAFLASISDTKFGMFTKEAAITRIQQMPDVSDVVKNKAVELLTDA